MTDRPFVTAHVLFSPSLAVVCPCGRPMTVTQQADNTSGPLGGEHGHDTTVQRCEHCNVQIDISIDA